MNIEMVIIPNDNNWLLSTTAQSTAALIAIVGAFILSESIKARSNLFELTLAISQIDIDIRRLVRERKLAGNALRLSNAKWFFNHHLKKIREFRGDVNFNNLWAEYSPPDCTIEERDKILNDLQTIIGEYYRALNGQAVPQRPAPTESIGDQQDFLLLEEFVRSRLANGKSTLDRENSREGRELRAMRAKTFQDFGLQLKASTEDRKKKSQQFEDIQKSPTLGRAYRLIIEFGFLGVIVPILLITLMPELDYWLIRWFVFFFFAFGCLRIVQLFRELISMKLRVPAIDRIED